YAMRENVNLFYPPSEVVSGVAPKDTQIRVGGFVVENSINRSEQDLTVTFQLTDGSSRITVSYEGILPDLFSEGEAAIAKGKLNQQNILVATEVLAKHDENYTPPEVEDTAVREKKVYDQGGRE
ncbi:MAG: cytochrome c maturation protein CcmE, partial [Pseudomonadales bacterium]|nr:cytochrome c maturation protein CcmE [Pseudomonadales bacterium]